nr:immunoglobulin lambda-1 light chain-like [Anolis sagrei ordinatus]
MIMESLEGSEMFMELIEVSEMFIKHLEGSKMFMESLEGSEMIMESLEGLVCSRFCGKGKSFIPTKPNLLLYGIDVGGLHVPLFGIHHISMLRRVGRFLSCYVSLWFVFGDGTHLSVTGQPAVPPSVSLFPPSQEELKSKNKATLACLMDGFHPGVVQVEWLGDGRTISTGVETTKPVKQGDKYIASSYLTLNRSEWEANESYICKVTHESKTIEKVVSRSACS